MPNYTDHYNLIKPLQSEHYDVDVANANNEKIDQVLFNKLEAISGKGLSTNDFTDYHKRKLESLTIPYNFRGVVDKYEDLPTLSTNGYIYGVKEENTTYIWNSELEEWIDLGPLVESDVLLEIEELKQRINELNDFIIEVVSPITTEDGLILATESGEFIITDR